MKLYRIKVINEKTGYTFFEYGFSKWMMARIHFLFHEVDYNYYHKYRILDIAILSLSWDTFKKCLTNKEIGVSIR